MLLVKSFTKLWLKLHVFPWSSDEDELEDWSNRKAPTGRIKYNMRKSLNLDQDGCYLQRGKNASLEECGFNATAKTIFIIHGWTVRICIISTITKFCLSWWNPRIDQSFIGGLWVRKLMFSMKDWLFCFFFFSPDEWHVWNLDAEAGFCSDAEGKWGQCCGGGLVVFGSATLPWCS